ncbi:MAG: NTP transferase domain-containing protein [Bradymonadia bacterium]
MSTRVEQAVILAAGLGSRIRSDAQPLPKPLVRVGGLTLLKRGILTARSAGVKRFVIVVGCLGEQVRAALDGDPDLAGLELVWVQNDDYTLKNGVSVLRARRHVRGEFFLTMADHIVEKAVWQTLQQAPARGGLVLAVDRKLDSIFDMDDATKVNVGDREQIVAIGKQIEQFDAVDTGVFRCDPSLFDALDEVFSAQGDVSLSEGVQALARSGRARVADVGAAWWQDVDDLPSRVEAERVLFAKLTKSTDGPVSRHINRRFSKFCTRLLMNTNVVPNHMTAVGLALGVAAALVTAFATPAAAWMLAIGAVLFQLSSMIDGCDGEIARLKFKQSARGEWFDTIADDVTNLSYLLALGIAAFRFSGEKIWLHLGVASFVVGWFVAAMLYRKLLASGKGTHLAIEWSFQRQTQKSWFATFVKRVEFIGHRDFYAMALMVLVLVGLMKVAIALSFVTVLIVFSQWAMTTATEVSTRRTDREDEAKAA